MGELNDRHEIEDENEDSINERIEEQMGENENVDEIQVRPEEIKTKGRSKGTTKAMMEIRKNLRREEEERRREHENVGRSKRIKEQQSAMIIIDKDIPKNVQEAEKSQDWKYWKQTIKEELTSMKKHGVWDIEPRPKDKRVIKCKWVFDIKEDPKTEQQRYKARLVAQGCGQHPGVDYGETFAPIVRIETIRLLFSISAQENRKMKIYDVKTAFLHGRLEEEIFMELPDGLQVNKEQVCKLKKSIYGLKQTGRC